MPGLAGQDGWPYSLPDSSVSIWITGGMRDNRRRGARGGVVAVGVAAS